MTALSIKLISDSNVRLTIDDHVYYVNPMTEEEKREEADADAIFVLEAGELAHKNDPTQSSGEGYELKNGIRLFQKPSSEIWCSQSFKRHIEQRIADARAGRCRSPGEKEFYSSLVGKVHWLHPHHVIVREGFTIRLLEFTQEPLFPAQKSGILITIQEKSFLIASGSACKADYTASAVPKLEMLILDLDAPEEQTDSLAAFIQFLKPGKIFFKGYVFRKKVLAALLEKLKELAPETEVIRQKHFRMTL
ncbi:hypothetical protein [Archangium sp.]|uniref:hypothetical protein n=1 Tax=Archangium sp. TaxID=1872627 RepID=UPI002D300487|nr:hypothetical protein [Archangium sp.]HYO55730.1 hypothetical protein [Archangium sp.]